MAFMKRLIPLLFLGFIAACGPANNTESGETETVVEEQNVETPETETNIPSSFEFDPRLTWDEFANSVAGEAFPDDNMAGFSEWSISGWSRKRCRYRSKRCDSKSGQR